MRLDRADALYNLHALHHTTKDCVFVVQPRLQARDLSSELKYKTNYYLVLGQ